MSSQHVPLPQRAKIVDGLSNTVPSTTTPRYVSMKGASKLSILISVKNASSGVTASAITLKQATAVAGTSEKALAFTSYWANLDTAASDTLVLTTATSNTFSPVTTNSKIQYFVIDVNPEDLDGANGFKCVRLGTADGVAQTITATYLLEGLRYPEATPPTAITD